MRLTLPTSKVLGCLTLLSIIASCQSQSTTPSAKGGKYLYRYLTAISDEIPSKQALTELCIEKYGFSLETPQSSVKSAHSIRIPAYDSTTTYRIEDVTKKKKITTQLPPRNGIIFKPAEEDIYYMEKEKVARTLITKGVCIGTEYILD